MSSVRHSPYFGEERCEILRKNGLRCPNNAYFCLPVGDETKFACGAHSRGKQNRIELEKNPQERKLAETALALHAVSITKETARNFTLDIPGKLSGFKMQMMRKVPLKAGVLNVFPNFRHQNRIDGFGCSSLSPMNLGPVKHGEPIGNDVSANLENFYQFSKVYANEVDAFLDPEDEWFNMRDRAFADPIGRRHKYDSTIRKAAVGADKTLYSLHFLPDSKEMRYDYIQSRWFYCIHYEHLVKSKDDFRKLKEKLANGTSLCICGFDAFNPERDEKTHEITAEILYKHYTDPSRPFGHELVLITMLTLPDSQQYPWNVYHEKNRHWYPPVPAYE